MDDVIYPLMPIHIIQGDNTAILPTFPDGYFHQIYIDPPYNTGKVQKRGTIGYDDKFSNYQDFIIPRIKEAFRLLDRTGSFFIHLDYREVHYVKVWTDEIFGRDNFMNELIWAYDYGGRSKKKWSAKHDNILWYVKDHKNYTFNYDKMERVPYMAPGLCGPEKAARGKVPTDCFFHTIVPTMGKEKTGYPTQKPIGVLRRIVNIHSNPGDRILDFFAGSGSFGAVSEDRDCWLIDQNPDAIAIMKKRFNK